MIDMMNQIQNLKVEAAKGLENRAKKAKKQKEDTFNTLLSAANKEIKSKDEKTAEVKECEKVDAKVTTVDEVKDKIDEVVSDDKKSVKDVLSELIALFELLTQSEEVVESLPQDYLDKIQGLVQQLSEIVESGDLNQSVNMEALIKNLEEIEGVVERIENSETPKVDFEMIKKIVDKANRIIEKETPVNEVKLEAEIPKVVVEEVKPSEEGTTTNEKGSGESKAKDDVDVLNNILNSGKKTTVTTSYFKNFSSVEPTEKPQTIRANHMTYDVVKNIKFMTNSDLKEMTLRIVPKELGEITIKLSLESGIMKANIAAVNKDTAELLQSNGAVIQEKLEETGLKLDKVQVEIYQEDATFHSDSDGEKSFQNKYKQNIEKVTESIENEEETEIAEDYVINAMA